MNTTQSEIVSSRYSGHTEDDGLKQLLRVEPGKELNGFDHLILVGLGIIVPAILLVGGWQ